MPHSHYLTVDSFGCVLHGNNYGYIPFGEESGLP